MPENETNLVKTTYLDALAVLQQEKDLKKIDLNNKARLEKQARKKVKKRERDEKIVTFYLTEKFPDAFKELGAKNLSEKELPSILKRAKRYFRLQIAAAGAVLSLTSGGAIASLNYWQTLGFLIITPILVIAFITLPIAVLFISDIVSILTKGVYWTSIPENNDSETPSLGDS